MAGFCLKYILHLFLLMPNNILNIVITAGIS